MSKASEQLAARAARAASKRTGEPVEQSAPTPRPRTTRPRTETVRITVDLAPLLYRRLGAWCVDAAEQVGVAKVTAAEVIRALISEVDEDPELAQAIRDRLRADGDK